MEKLINFKDSSVRRSRIFGIYLRTILATKWKISPHETEQKKQKQKKQKKQSNRDVRERTRFLISEDITFYAPLRSNSWIPYTQEAVSCLACISGIRWAGGLSCSISGEGSPGRIYTSWKLFAVQGNRTIDRMGVKRGRRESEGRHSNERQTSRRVTKLTQKYRNRFESCLFRSCTFQYDLRIIVANVGSRNLEAVAVGGNRIKGEQGANFHSTSIPLYSSITILFTFTWYWIPVDSLSFLFNSSTSFYSLYSL